MTLILHPSRRPALPSASDTATRVRANNHSDRGLRFRPVAALTQVRERTLESILETVLIDTFLAGSSIECLPNRKIDLIAHESGRSVSQQNRHAIRMATACDFVE